MKRTLQLTACAAVLAVATQSAQAEIIFGSETLAGSAPLTRYDTVANTTTTLATSIPDNMGLSFDFSDNLFGIVNVGGNQNTLYSINTVTGAATPIGTGTYSGFVEAATFNLSGQLLAATSFSGPRLFTVNTGNGAATDLGAITGMSDVDGLTVAPVAVNTSSGLLSAGTIFAIDSGGLYTINQTTLVATLMHSGVNALETIAFAADGTLFGNNSSDYVTINLVTGGSTVLGGPGAWGSSVQGSLSSVVPEPTSLTLLGMGVLSLCGYGWRRKRTA